jgi:hypothetical protein
LEALARRFLKTALFIGLLLFVMRFIHVIPFPLTLEQQQYCIELARWLHVEDWEALIMIVTTIVDIVVSIVIYKVILAIWNWRTTSRLD